MTAVCCLALAAAVAMVVRWGGLEALPVPEPEGEERPTPASNMRRTLRALAVSLYSGVIAGVLVGGFGGRLLMRFMAATSSDSVQGVLTEAEENVGEVTFGGTAFLIVFAGVFVGLIGGLLYKLVRRWLPAPAWRGGAVLGVMVLGLVGVASGVLNSSNKDFTVLSPSWLAVTMVVAGAVLFGMCLASLHERLELGMPEISRRWTPVMAFVPLFVLGATPVTGVLILTLLLLGSVGAPTVRRLFSDDATLRAGRVLASAGGVVGAAIVAFNAYRILALN
ncbi:MAG: hypothetical protein QOI61_2323 [Actinomycetota bacterium]